MTDAALVELARRWGVQTGYWDTSGVWNNASVETLVAVLSGLGAPITSPADAVAAIAAHERDLVARPVEPVFTAKAHEPLGFQLRLPAGSQGSIRVTLTTEDSQDIGDTISLAAVAPHGGGEVDGQRWEERWVVTALRAPVGYHRAVVEVAGFTLAAAVVVAPPWLTPFHGGPSWGVFAPTYGFVPTGRPGHDHLGIGHIGHLAELGERVAPFGARVVSTLPLLATFLDAPFEPSPYSPVSRRWWSELHLDPRHLPGLAESPAARELLSSNRVARAAADLASQSLIDHRGAARLVQEILDALVADIDVVGSPTAAAITRFGDERPELERYARFRALVEHHGDQWGIVRSERSDHDIARSEVDPMVVARHRYIQFAAEQQMSMLAAEYRSRDQLLALDLPLGANPDGFDVWANPDDFASAMATGAPPDDFFSGGQNWGFPPIHPITSRARGHEELKLAVRHHVRHSGLLRIDHLMSLERLWWIPTGHGATDGAYVRYPTHELMSVIAIEAARADAVVMGENLGTVTDEINETMQRWRMLGMYELQFETWRASEQGTVRVPPADSVAGLNTHDMPTFAGWWAGHDIVDAVDLGLIDPADAPARLEDRRAQIEAFAGVLAAELDVPVPVEQPAVLQAALEWLGRTPAQVVMATLEDLWLEERPQNVPGTHRERPNWRRRFASTLDEVFETPSARQILEALHRTRTDSLSEDTP